MPSPCKSSTAVSTGYETSFQNRSTKLSTHGVRLPASLTEAFGNLLDGVSSIHTPCSFPRPYVLYLGSSTPPSDTFRIIENTNKHQRKRSFFPAFCFALLRSVRAFPGSQSAARLRNWEHPSCLPFAFAAAWVTHTFATLMIHKHKTYCRLAHPSFRHATCARPHPRWCDVHAHPVLFSFPLPANLYSRELPCCERHCSELSFKQLQRSKRAQK